MYEARSIDSLFKYLVLSREASFLVISDRRTLLRGNWGTSSHWFGSKSLEPHNVGEDVQHTE